MANSLTNGFFSIALICFLVAPSLAQTNGDETISVAVKDQLGGALAGIEVTLVDSAEKETRIETNDLGIAQFSKLTAGKYRITVRAQFGFAERILSDISVGGNEKKNLEIALEVASIESNVEIGAEEAVEAEKTGTTTVLDEEEIAKLPDNQEDFERALKQIGESVAGEQLPITVNGVEGGKIPPKQQIQQIRVNQNVFSAQYDSPFGGGIEIFTRAGVDAFKGYVSFSFADARFNAADPFLGTRAPYQSRNYYFNLSGPLLGKKANFFVYGSRSESDVSAIVNAVVLDANLQPAEFKQSFAAPSRSENVSLTVNADPTKKHKLYFNYNFGMSRARGQTVGNFSLPSRAGNIDSQNHYFQFSDTFLINPNVVNQTRFLAAYFTTDNFGSSDEAAINVLDAFFGGGSQQNGSNKNFRFDATNETTWQMGRYALGFGFRLRGERISQNSTANFGGTYTFSGRTAPVLDASNNPVTDAAGNILTAQISSLESYRRTLLFRQIGYSDQRIRELGGGANQLTISGGDPQIEVAQYDAAVYVQNSYKISETVHASFGLRYENQTNLSSRFNFAPRFGIIWAPKAKEKSNPLYALPRVSIGYGVFYTRFALNNTLNIRQTIAGRTQYLITDASVLDSFPNVPTASALQQFAVPQTRRLLAEEFETPYQSRLNLTVVKPLPKGYSLNLTYSRGAIFRQTLTQNINAPIAGTFSAINPALAVRPFGSVGNIYETSSAGRIINDGFSVNLNFPQSQKLFASIRYSFSKSKDNLVGGSGSPFDAYDFAQEFAPGIYDGVHRLSGYFYYNLPAGFSVGSDFSLSSGTRFNIYTGRDTNGDGFFNERPAFATDLTKPGLIETPYGTLDPNPSPGDRLIPRNLGRGPRNFVFNSSLSKTFKFNEDVANKKPPRQTLNFSVRVSNVFNVINRGNPIGNLSSPNFLRSLSGFSDGSIYFINGAQQIGFPGRSMTFSVGFGF